MAALPAMNSRRRMRPLKDNAMGGRASHFAADLCAAIAACKLIRLSSDKSIHQCFHGDDVLLRAINGPHGDPDFHGRSGLVNGLRRADFRQRSDARLDEAPEAGMMPSAQMRRDDQFDRLSNRLLLGIAKQLLGVPAPRQDAAGRVDGERRPTSSAPDGKKPQHPSPDSGAGSRIIHSVFHDARCLTIEQEVTDDPASPMALRTGTRVLKNLLTDIPGVKVGHADDARLASGVTAILFDKPAVAAIDVRGGGPGTREEALLEPGKHGRDGRRHRACPAARRSGSIPPAACRPGLPNRAAAFASATP